jgi:3-methylcrotonyl-CoA carboxylase alpha subunit
MIRTLLIANRGEIACRIIRTARHLGVRTVAVFSDADADALHVSLADEALRLGPAPAAESYLNTAAVLAAAATTGADAIHPGYGFLSENAEFAAAVQEAGMRFVGPPPQAIAAMGSKSRAKALMAEAGVPLLPGYHGDAQDLETLQQASTAVGFPLLIKATAGGGGKGMRLVESAAALPAALAAVQREAKASFGDARVLLERYLRGPRHVEVQVFCDSLGNGVYLGDRDCSLQRRHQKVIEEAPAPGLDAATRRAMGEAAVRAAQAINYEGAGTVEFLLDRDGAFYFMEMNTRLQVEHPVTEYITGQDLVAWQLHVAAGDALPLSQEQISLNGHAMEARIYAEDTAAGFLPAAGRIAALELPAPNDWLRIDTGIRAGDEVSVHYDPMIAKLIVWGENREQARRRLGDALSRLHIAGLPTNLDFLRRLAEQADFAAQRLSTHLIDDHRDALCLPAEVSDELLLMAALAVVLHRQRDQHWAGSGWRLNAPHRQTLTLRTGERTLDFQLDAIANAWRVDSALGEHQIGGTLTQQRLNAVIDGHRRQASVWLDGHRVVVFDGKQELTAERVQPDLGESDDATPGACIAPMNGRIVTLLAGVGESVPAGEGLLILEAMKMEHTVRAPAHGVVGEYFVTPGDLVAGGTELLRFDVEAVAENT